MIVKIQFDTRHSYYPLVFQKTYVKQSAFGGHLASRTPEICTSWIIPHAAMTNL